MIRERSHCIDIPSIGDLASDTVLIGIDIGGTKIEGGIIEQPGTVAETIRRTTASDGSQVLLQTIAIATDLQQIAHRRGLTVISCGVGTAGVVVDNEIVSANSLIPHWEGQPLRRELESAIGVPVYVLNDVHASALGECSVGAGQNCSSALVVAIGTGLGSAVISDGRLLIGMDGLAGSLGHIPSVLREGRLCACGVRDHVEAYVGGRALEKEFDLRSGEKLKMPGIAAKARAGDTISIDLLRSAGFVLGHALATAVALFNPERIILNGGMMAIGDLLLKPARETIKSDAMVQRLNMPLTMSSLGDCATLIGAGLYALAEHTN